MSRLQNPLFGTDVDVLHEAFRDYPHRLDFELPVRHEWFDSDKAMLAAAAAVIAECWAIRGTGGRVRSSVQRSQKVLDLLASCFDRTVPVRPSPPICAAFAYATRLDDWVGRRDCVEGMVNLKAQAMLDGRHVSTSELGRRGYMFTPAGVDRTLAMEKGPVTGAAFRKIWADEPQKGPVTGSPTRKIWKRELDARVEEAAALRPGDDWSSLMSHERDDVGPVDVPYIVAAMRWGDAQQVRVAAHATYLLITRPDVLDFRMEALKAAAAVLLPAQLRAAPAD